MKKSLNFIYNLMGLYSWFTDSDFSVCHKGDSFSGAGGIYFLHFAVSCKRACKYITASHLLFPLIYREMFGVTILVFR